MVSDHIMEWCPNYGKDKKNNPKITRRKNNHV